MAVLENLAASRMLTAWEAGAGASPALRGARLLAALDGTELDAGYSAGGGAAGGGTEDAYLDTPLGVIDRRLLRLYATEFDPVLEGSFACTACGDGLEVRVPLEALLASRGPAEPASLDGGDGPWRYPTPRALLAADATDDRAAALLRFALAGDRNHVVSDTVRGELAAAMAEADPLLDVTFDTECPSCGTRVSARLDVATFVLAAVADRARRLLTEVDRLARAYGWSEAEVLGLSERRRRAYLSLASTGVVHV
jgi:hypothetical protein